MYENLKGHNPVGEEDERLEVATSPEPAPVAPVEETVTVEPVTVK